MGLYAADEDLRSRDGDGHLHDAFVVVLTSDGGREQRLEVTLPCNVTGGGTRVKVACDADGTLDDPSDDEEWGVEMAIPLDTLGLASGAHSPIH